MVFACYLDAARHDKESPIVSMAGYIAPFQDWLPFETAANAICDVAGVRTIHGYDLDQTKGDFKGWSRERKEGFVRSLQEPLIKTGAIGFAFSVHKKEFAAAKKLHQVMPQESAYGFCFRSIAGLICDDPIMRMHFDQIPGADISFILESGDPNSRDVDRIFDDLKLNSPYRGRLKAVTRAPKDSTRSLQMADLLAFYSRRHVANFDEKAGNYGPDLPMLAILRDRMHIEGLVAHDFQIDRLSAFRKKVRKSSRRARPS